MKVLHMLYLRALLFSVGLQVAALFYCTSNVGNAAGFGKILAIICMVIFTPQMLATLVIGNFLFAPVALEILCWVVQVGVWFAIFYIALFWRARAVNKN